MVVTLIGMTRHLIVGICLSFVGCGVEPPELEQDVDAVTSPLVLVDTQGAARSSVEVGESVLVSLDKQAPSGSVRLVVRDAASGAEVLSEQLVVDKTGALPPTLLWPDIGLGHAKTPLFSFSSLDSARQALGGRSFAVELYAGKSLVGKAPLSISKDLLDARIYPSDAKGSPARGPTADTEVWITAKNLAPKTTVDVVLVREQAGWTKGDAIAAALDLDGNPLVRRVTLDGTGSLTTAFAKGGSLPVGRFQIVVLPANGIYADRPFDPSTDQVSDRLLATIQIRPGTLDPPSVRAIQIAGRTAAGVPGFAFTDSFEAGTGVSAALDPDALGTAAGRKLRYYVIPHRAASAWATSTSLSDVTGRVVEVVTRADSIGANRVLLWPDAAPGDYDVIADFGNAPDDPAAFVSDAHFDVTRDLIDGYGRVGFHVGPDPSLPGAFPVGSATFSGTPIVIPDPGVTITEPANASVRYPATTAGANAPISPARASYPLVVVMHGQGLPWNGYDYLIDQLASQGYVAAEIECDEVRGGIADPITDYARCLLGYLPQLSTAPGPFQGHLDLSRVALVGHSRGGDGVVLAESLNRSEHLGWNLRAIVSMAPTDQSGATLQTPFLCLYGSNDNDVGRANGFPYASHGGTAFGIYDRAQAEKALVFLRDANHDQFSTTPASDTAASLGSVVISAADQQNLARGYVTAFLQWQLDGRTEQREYFVGPLVVASASGVRVRRQHEPAAASMRLVDDFSGPSTTVNELGGAVGSLGFEQALVGVASDLDRSSPNTTRATLLRWTGPAFYSTALPAGARNVLPYAALSLRVGQTYGYVGSLFDQISGSTSTWSTQLDARVVSAPFRTALADNHVVSISPSAAVTVLIPGSQWQIDDGGGEHSWIVKRIHQGDATTPTQYDLLQFWRRGATRNHTTFDQTLRVRLIGGDGRYRDVDVGWNESLAYPDRPTLTPLAWDYDDRRTLAVMQTVRIPLSDFTLTAAGADPVDLTNVIGITLQLGQASGTTRSGELLVDDLAFVP